MKIKENKNKHQTGKNLFDSEIAGATVVAAVLLLGIIFTIFAIVRVEYIPELKIDAEQSHMNDVQKNMAQLKSTVDMITFLTFKSANYSAHEIPVTIPFSIGGGEIPILDPYKSSGTLSINTELCNITITPKKSSILRESYNMECGGITYTSNNRQYVDQVFRYENGALIVSQGKKSLMKQFPLFNVERNQTNLNSYNFSIQAVSIIGSSDSISSNSDVSLRLKGLNFTPIYDSNDTGNIDSFDCTIITEYPDAWYSYLDENVKNEGLDKTDYELRSNESSDGLYEVYFEFPKNEPNNTKKLESLYISESFIQAKLGIGSS